jgi:hypothetical protein
MPHDPIDNTWARSGAVPTLSMTVGTANNTVDDVGAAFNQATLNNNFRDVVEKLNAVITALREAEIISEG